VVRPLSQRTGDKLHLSPPSTSTLEDVWPTVHYQKLQVEIRPSLMRLTGNFASTPNKMNELQGNANE